MSSPLVQHYLDAACGTGALRRTAVADDCVAISYEELSAISSRLARCLREMGVRRGDRVAFCLDRSVWPVVTALSVLKADAIYVPIHHRTPPGRMAVTLEDCSPVVVVCNAITIAVVRAALGMWKGGARIVALGVFRADGGEVPPRTVFQEEIDATGDASLCYENSSSDLAYLLYTSGSTGRPKGVMITHRNVRDYIDWAARAFQVGPDDRFLGTAPFTFDMSTFDIFCPLRMGATLYVAPEESLMFPAKLIGFMEQNAVTVWKGVSSLLMYLARTGVVVAGRVPSLRTVMFGGEALPTKYLIHWMQAFPEKTFYNVYGPTETTGVSAAYRVSDLPCDPGESIPIGKARDNTEMFVIEEDGRPAAAGRPGQICIRGAGLSPGYWNDEELTRRAFREIEIGEGPPQRTYLTGDRGMLRADGHCVYLGRTDRQVKCMGYRVELDDIERVLLSLVGVRDGAVVLRPSDRCDVPQLDAFVEMEGERKPQDVLRELGARLPPYMVPKQLIPVTHMPRTERGKIDRQKLVDWEN